MVPDDVKACVGLEYFCFQGDDLWEMDDDALVELAKDELAALGLVAREKVERGFVTRVPLAYPMYDADYAERVDAIRDWLETLGNLQQVGRNGLHRYNNSDHSMLTAIRAVDNVLNGAGHDLWAVNAESVYHEEHQEAEQPYRRAPETRGDARAAQPERAEKVRNRTTGRMFDGVRPPAVARYVASGGRLRTRELAPASRMRGRKDSQKGGGATRRVAPPPFARSGARTARAPVSARRPCRPGLERVAALVPLGEAADHRVGVVAGAPEGVRGHAGARRRAGSRRGRAARGRWSRPRRPAARARRGGRRRSARPPTRGARGRRRAGPRRARSACGRAAGSTSTSSARKALVMPGHGIAAPA